MDRNDQISLEDLLVDERERCRKMTSRIYIQRKFNVRMKYTTEDDFENIDLKDFEILDKDLTIMILFHFNLIYLNLLMEHYVDKYNKNLMIYNMDKNNLRDKEKHLTLERDSQATDQ